MILFLDIDGVLHPAGCAEAERFRALPRLVALLREVTFRRVDIVLTAPALGSFSVRSLRDTFPADLRHRMIGATDVAADGKTDGRAVPRIGQREHEIRSWLARGGGARQHAGRSWVAVDDAAHLYAPHCPQLVAVDASTGLDAAGVAQLRRRLVCDRGLPH